MTFRRAVPWRSTTALVAVACLASSAARADETSERALRVQLESTMKELRAVELRVEEMKRLAPAFDPAREVAALRGLAQAAGLAALEVKPVVDAGKATDAQSSPLETHRLEISGRAPYDQIHLFLRSITRLPRAIDLELLRLHAQAGGAVAFSARIAIPSLGDGSGARTAAPKPAANTGESPAARMLADVRNRLLELEALQESLGAQVERAKRAHVVEALAAFSDDVDGEALALTEITVGAETVLDGVTLGSVARARLKPALEKAGFEVGATKVSPTGECEAFTISARFKGTDTPFAGVPGGVFDDRTAAQCRTEASPLLGHVAARGSAGQGALALRLRDADVGDAFHALHDLSGQGFVLDSAVKGRLDLDVEGATLDEVLAAFRSAGVAVGKGSLRRVSSAAAPPPASTGESYDASPLSVAFKDASLVGVLCVFEKVSGLPILVPAGLRGQVSIFARELPWDGELEAVIASAGLTRAIEANRLYVGSRAAVATAGRPGFVDVCEIREPDGRRTWTDRFTRLDAIGVLDLKLFGLARGASGWSAYAYGPMRKMWPLQGGDTLLGGRVSAVGPTGVTFQTEAKGVVEVPLRP